MPNGVFYCFGKLIYKCRWLIIFLWLGLLLTCIPFIPKLMDPFNAIGFTDSKSESARANNLLNEKLGYSYNRFIVMYHSDTLLATHPEYLRQIKTSLKGLHNFTVQHHIIYPDIKNKQISADKHTAYAVILFKGNQEADNALLTKLKIEIKKPPHLSMQLGGEPIFLDDTKKQTQIDLYKAEYIATPVAIVTMLIVFESVVAASLPIILGGVCALLILFMLYCLGHVFSLSVFTINIALLLGLCLSLDYALLLINRYRDELETRKNVEEALAVTQATAGKAIFFSGLAVFISLSALLLFPINVLFSVGMGGLAAVTVAVAMAVFLLPALLAVLNSRINLLPIRLFKRQEYRKNGWHWLVTKVVRRPLVFFVVILGILLSLGYPFLKVKFGISDFRILPKTLESREVFDTFKDKFGDNNLSPILALVETRHSNILTKNHIGDLYEFSDRIKRDPSVERITGIVNTVPRLTKQQYELLYTHLKDNKNDDVKELIDVTTHENVTVLTILSKYPSSSPATTDFVKKLRHSHPGDHLKLSVTGTSVNTIDALCSISKTFPYAFLWIVGFTYLVLLILLRSVVLPLKAILTTILSLCASYGILVLVIQQGLFHHLLNFEPQGMLDVSLLIIIFCALFGISMDYEVFLLTRIKEFYEQTGNNKESIEFGIERSSKIISSAAIIVILICFSFMSADVLIVKAFGLGIAVAVFVDAFIIRSILVPATMTLLGKWNWYLPKWLGKILPKIVFDPEQYSGKK